jgi:hypothetical protein
MTIGNGRVPPAGTTIRGERDDLPLGRLERWMRDHVDGFRGPLFAERFEGGQSQPDLQTCRRYRNVCSESTRLIVLPLTTVLKSRQDRYRPSQLLQTL